MPDKQRALYRGDGKFFLNGVPARNLSEDDYQALTDDQKAEVQASNLYDFRSDSEMSGTTTARTSARPPAAISGEPAKDADTKPAGNSA